MTLHQSHRWRPSWSRWSKATVAAIALVTGTGSLNETEIVCEEAIAHIRDCCPELRVGNVCGDAAGSCTPVTTLSLAESHCIGELQCGAQADEVCGRIQILSDAVAGEGPLPEAMVCP